MDIVRFRSKMGLVVCLLPAALKCFGQTSVWRSPVLPQQEALALLEAVCPSSAVQLDTGATPAEPYCKPCPAYTTVGSVSPEMAVRGAFDLETVIHGSFTTAGAEEAVANFRGCEPHASGYGGTVLLSKLRESWKMVNYTPALITSSCKAYPMKNGRDLLLCEGEDHHMAGASRDIEVCGFSQDGTSQCQSLFGVVDTRVACGHTAVWGSIDQVALSDLNGDGMPDLTIWFRVGSGSFPNDGGPCATADTASAPTEKYQLDFLFEQSVESFRPAPRSQALADRYQAFFKDALQKALEAVVPAPVH